MTLKIMSALIIAMLISGCTQTDVSSAILVKNAGVENFEVVSVDDAYGGQIPPGAKGPYQVITATVHGSLDPTAAINAGIVNLNYAPTNDQGLVEYTTDVVILRPKKADSAKRVLFYDVVNRGHKIVLMTAIGGGSPIGGEPPPSSFPSLLQYGYTFVWSGWQGDIELSNGDKEGLVGTSFPFAQHAMGTAITARAREEIYQRVSIIL